MAPEVPAAGGRPRIGLPAVDGLDVTAPGGLVAGRVGRRSGYGGGGVPHRGRVPGGLWAGWRVPPQGGGLVWAGGLGAGTMGSYPAGVPEERRPSRGIGRLEEQAGRGPTKVSRMGYPKWV
jgi:hypothetical protein